MHVCVCTHTRVKVRGWCCIPPLYVETQSLTEFTTAPHLPLVTDNTWLSVCLQGIRTQVLMLAQPVEHHKLRHLPAPLSQLSSV